MPIQQYMQSECLADIAFAPAEIGMNALVVPNGSRSAESTIIQTLGVEQISIIFTSTVAADLYVTVYAEDKTTALLSVKFANIAAAATAVLNLGLEMTPAITNGTIYAGVGLRLPLHAISLSVQGTSASGTTTARVILQYN
jgi:hypothetical protein